ncbi:hypothetical protein BCR44DRAFT_1481851 [Catenaria anguillulae PL171]|uniref:Uncharacterized protein n=1 Tax=Catenaria anguillulae PL171 TaxID=765915 RepID=A0A1Y2I1Q6_9FUNG|nr:hypothetical protein BCR44DRAFT_1481851 [Catenaria anguillulae PL171]
MDDISISRSAADRDASHDNDTNSNSTEDGSLAEADADDSTARQSSTATLSRDKAKSLSRLPFADKQQVVREMFARREQSGKSALAVPRDNAGTSTSELDDGQDGLSASARGPANKVKRKGVPLPGLNAMNEEDDLQSSRARPRPRNLLGKTGSDTEDPGASESNTRSRSASPAKVRGKRIPLKSGDEPKSSTKTNAKPDKSPAKESSDRKSTVASSTTPQQQSNGGQSITIRLPAPAQATNSVLLPSSAPPPFAFPLPSPSPSLSATSDKLLLRQTVSSFEQCLHHALDMNTALLAQMTRQQAHPPPTFIPNLIPPTTAPARQPVAAGSTRSPQRPTTYPTSVSGAEHAQRAVEYAQGLHKIKELIAQVQATTAKHAKAMDVMVQAVNAERDRRTADEVKGLVSLLAGGAGHATRGNGERIRS